MAPMPAPPVSKPKLPANEPGAAFTQGFFFDNDGVTYVWNHIYLKRDRSAYEVSKPVSGTRPMTSPSRPKPV